MGVKRAAPYPCVAAGKQRDISVTKVVPEKHLGSTPCSIPSPEQQSPEEAIKTGRDSVCQEEIGVYLKARCPFGLVHKISFTATYLPWDPWRQCGSE